MNDLLLKTKPKLGFLGVGWIGRSRLQAIIEENVGEISLISDLDPVLTGEALQLAPAAEEVSSLSDLISGDVDGVIIATPSALHAAQALQAIRKGKAVFCQKPLGRNAREVQTVVEAAKEMDVLLRVDFSYRFTKGFQALKEAIKGDELGFIYGINLVFHNAYGPDKAWYFDPALAGGGCVMDLGVHLVDLLVWLFDNPTVDNVCSELFSKGSRVSNADQQVEDYAVAQFLVNGGISVQMACSWNLAAGTDAIIEASFYGTRGGISFKNINGSFYHFNTQRFHGTSSETVSTPDDNWGGKAAVAWASELGSEGNRFNEEAMQYIRTAEILDEIYKEHRL